MNVLLPERKDITGFNALVTHKIQLQLLLLVVFPTEKTNLITFVIHLSEVHTCVLFTDRSSNAVTIGARQQRELELWEFGACGAVPRAGRGQCELQAVLGLLHSSTECWGPPNRAPECAFTTCSPLFYFSFTWILNHSIWMSGREQVLFCFVLFCYFNSSMPCLGIIPSVLPADKYVSFFLMHCNSQPVCAECYHF